MQKHIFILFLFYISNPITAQYYKQATITKVISDHELIVKTKAGEVWQLAVRNCISPTDQPTCYLTPELKGNRILLHPLGPPSLSVAMKYPVIAQIMLDSLNDDEHLIEIIYCPNP